VLHLARLEADAMTPQLQPVDLVAEAQATRQELAPMARRAGVDLAVHPVSGGAVCSTDPFAVQRILRNLVGNAIKFTERGGRVDLAVSRGRRGTMVEVSDTGIGMTTGFQRRMFDAFTQESEGIRREHEGSGLGLAIVHKLVELVGGDIEVESTRGHGTRIAVFFPTVSRRDGPVAGE
jgi:signal transduction histidine kinase